VRAKFAPRVVFLDARGSKKAPDDLLAHGVCGPDREREPGALDKECRVGARNVGEEPTEMPVGSSAVGSGKSA
jgi:hypothetical protein